MRSTGGLSGDVIDRAGARMNTDNVKAWLAIAGLAAGLISAAPVMAQPVALRSPEEGQVRALLVGIDAYRNVRPLKGPCQMRATSKVRCAAAASMTLRSCSMSARTETR